MRFASFVKVTTCKAFSFGVFGVGFGSFGGRSGLVFGSEVGGMSCAKRLRFGCALGWVCVFGDCGEEGVQLQG